MITLNTNMVELGVQLPPFESFNTIYNSTDCMLWCHGQNAISGWTYTFNPNVLRWARISKLIVGNFSGYKSKHVRYATHCHIKCYIGDSAALIGSFNLTQPTIEDMAVFIKDKKLLAHLRKQHKLHWNALA
jgi:hypothetical protein